MLDLPVGSDHDAFNGVLLLRLEVPNDPGICEGKKLGQGRANPSLQGRAFSFSRYGIEMGRKQDL